MKYRNRSILLLSLGVLLGLWPALAQADSFRCPETGQLIHPGETAGEVLGKCGEPQYRSQSSFILRRINKFESAAIEVEEWTYDFGPNRFIQLLRFEGGRLRRLEHGSYGTVRPRRHSAR